MAVKLVLEFRDATATSRKWSFGNADQDVTRTNVKALMDAMIANGSIYKYPPVSKVSAQIVKTTTDEIDVSD